MNAVFFAFCAFSLIFCIIRCPNLALPAMINGANKSLILIFTLASVYCVWMGIYKILDLANITDFFARALTKPVCKLFKTKNKKIIKTVSLNLISNSFGLGGIATPLGIESCKLFEEEGNLRGANLLTVISASSIQILPTTVISLISSYGGKNPESIIFPSLICTAFSTLFAVFLFLIFEKTFFVKSKKIKRG